MRRLAGSIAVVAIAGLCWWFPPFHIVPLKVAEAERAGEKFDPTGFAEKFWATKLLKSLDQAVKVEILLPAIRSDAVHARKNFGRSVGVSESYTFFLVGEGRVVVANEDEISLALTSSSTNAEVALQAGLLFGNAVRDGTGLINVNDYPNSQDFNAISAALNHIVETRVQPKLRELARVGATVRFVGCAEVDDEATDLHPLKVVPITVTVK